MDCIGDIGSGTNTKRSTIFHRFYPSESRLHEPQGNMVLMLHFILTHILGEARINDFGKLVMTHNVPGVEFSST